MASQGFGKSFATSATARYMKKPLKIPKFNNEDKEREFWSNLDLSEYFEASDFEPVSFPNLKPSTTPISIRLPNHTIFSVKERANSMDVPYQSLIKQYIAQGLALNAGIPMHVEPRKKAKFAVA